VTKLFTERSRSKKRKESRGKKKEREHNRGGRGEFGYLSTLCWILAQKDQGSEEGEIRPKGRLEREKSLVGLWLTLD